ncbi:hypothetical protein GGR56DRAFT_274245 [Xylariaceae sp. FL0804]|nr:hypothetical protein GGR56DRAFT_274245 [Xylariaceae sp. FL0804]
MMPESWTALKPTAQQLITSLMTIGTVLSSLLIGPDLQLMSIVSGLERNVEPLGEAAGRRRAGESSASRATSAPSRSVIEAEAGVSASECNWLVANAIKYVLRTGSTCFVLHDRELAPRVNTSRRVPQGRT